MKLPSPTRHETTPEYPRSLPPASGSSAPSQNPPAVTGRKAGTGIHSLRDDRLDEALLGREDADGGRTSGSKWRMPRCAKTRSKLLKRRGLWMSTPRTRTERGAPGMTRNKKLLGAPGLTTRNKKLLGAPGLTTRSKDATRGSWHD